VRTRTSTIIASGLIPSLASRKTFSHYIRGGLGADTLGVTRRNLKSELCVDDF
jgi:hypothetical protein